MTTTTRRSEKQLPSPRKAEGMWAHQFSSHPFEPVLARAEGVYLYDEEGRRYIDASGGPMAVNVGHGDPRIREAISAQLERFAYCHPTLSNRPAAELCEKIAAVTPGALDSVYLVCGGSEAVETAIKIARQTQILRGHSGKYQVITHRDSYHGMTLATLAASGNPSSQRHFDPLLPKWPKVRQYSPFHKPAGMTEEEWALDCVRDLEETIHYAGHGNVAAFLATPIGCGSDYGVHPPPIYWQAVREICDRYDVLLIADEVVTGFGRTGKWFCMEHFAVEPDIMTMAKGISSVNAPLGAVAVSDAVAEPFRKGATFVHGFTNGGHPLSVAAGAAVIDIVRQDGLVENAAQVGAYLGERTKEIQARHRTVVDFRGKGLLHVAELVKNPETMEFFDRSEQAETKLQGMALANGLALYGTLYGARRAPSLRRGLPLFLAPPLSITRDQVDDLIDRLDTTLREWEEALGVA